MEIDKYGIIGVVNTYKSNLSLKGLVKDLVVKDISKALKIVGLDDTYLNRDIKSLTISELWKIELLTKLDNNIIIVGNLSKSLIYKDQEYIKKLLVKLNKDYGKKIVMIDNDVSLFFNFAKRIYVTKNEEIQYETSDFYDDGLYEYANMPKIIEFVKYVNKSNKLLNENTDIYELIKDIYRSVS